jgi:transposase
MAHSTRSFSDDLRRRVVKARLNGISVEEVSAAFEVSRDSVYRWVKRHQETGSVSGRRRGGYKKPKIADMVKFEAFAKAHAHSTLTQMKEKWEGDVSAMAISRALKRLGWTRKKTL